MFSTAAQRAELDADKTRFQPHGSPVVSVAMHLVNASERPLLANASRFSDRRAGSPVGLAGAADRLAAGVSSVLGDSKKGLIVGRHPF